uniref:CCHC-type domain-containing protein n=1 Tax=Manihot esculenta TaxID=3983 RepID=A0A199UCF0_MANES
MAKREKLKGKVQEEEEQEDKPVMELSSGDDDDEDLSLTIVEKALLMRAANLGQNDNDGVFLDDDNASKNGCGLVGFCARDGIDSGEGKVVEMASSWVVKDIESVNKRKKRKKNQKKKTGDKSAVIAEQEEKAETIKKLETLGNAESVQTTVELAEMPENIVLRKLLRGPRYFDPPDSISSWSTCDHCGKQGHRAMNCLSLRKKKKPCFLCGGLEHGFKQCYKERVCTICKSKDHRLSHCPEKHKGGPSNVCLKCGDSGHDLFSCKNNYPLDDLKEIQCYVCKSFGHLCCVNTVDNSTIEVSCNKCGELGHTGLDCSSLHKKATAKASPSLC